MPISANSGFEYARRRLERPFDPGITSIHIRRNSCLTKGEALAKGFSVTSRFRIWWNSGCKPGLRLFASHPGLEPAEDLHPAEPVGVQPAESGARQVVLHGHGDANLRSAARFHSVESRRADSDDRQRPAIDDDLLADDAGSVPKARAPVAVAQHRQGMSSLNQVVGSSEHTAHRGPDAQHREVVARHKIDPDQFRAALERCTHGIRVRAEHAAENLVLVADLLVHRIRKAVWPLFPP